MSCLRTPRSTRKQAAPLAELVDFHSFHAAAAKPDDTEPAPLAELVDFKSFHAAKNVSPKTAQREAQIAAVAGAGQLPEGHRRRPRRDEYVDLEGPTGVSSDLAFTPPEHLCAAGHTGDAGGEHCVLNSPKAGGKDLKSLKNTKEKIRPRRPRSSSPPPEEQLVEADHTGDAGSKQSTSRDDSEVGLTSTKLTKRVSRASADLRWLELAQSVAGDGLKGPIVTVAPSIASVPGFEGVSTRGGGGDGWGRRRRERVGSSSDSESSGDE